MQINGSVDTGAKVIATGEVLITGNIRNGNVVTQSNLTVEGGIITSNTASAVCGGVLKANFIENSTVYCSGNIEVEKLLFQVKFVLEKILLSQKKKVLLQGVIFFCGEP